VPTLARVRPSFPATCWAARSRLSPLDIGKLGCLLSIWRPALRPCLLAPRTSCRRLSDSCGRCRVFGWNVVTCDIAGQTECYVCVFDCRSSALGSRLLTVYLWSERLCVLRVFEFFEYFESFASFKYFPVLESSNLSSIFESLEYFESFKYFQIVNSSSIWDFGGL
jgi:hypothetical protein